MWRVLRGETHAHAHAQNLQGTNSAPEPKRPRRTEAPDAVHYNNENAVDDLLPTWYYQQSNIPAKRNREFAQQFFRYACPPPNNSPLRSLGNTLRIILVNLWAYAILHKTIICV